MCPDPGLTANMFFAVCHRNGTRQKLFFQKFNLHELIRFQKLFTKFDQMDIENILPKTLDNSCFMILSEKFFFFCV